MRVVLMLLALSTSSGAVAHATQQAPAPAEPPSPATIAYSLPSSSVKVAVGLTLRQCRQSFEAKPELTFAPIVSPNPHQAHRLSLDGRNLSSFWKNKKLSLETYPSGSIKSLNGAIADQSGSIISSIIKLAGNVLALDQAVGRTSLTGQCKPEVLAALDRVDQLEKRIKTLQASLATVPAAQIASTKEAITALAAEVGRLRNEDLHLELSRELVLDPKVTGGTLQWKRSDFAKWLKDPTDGSTSSSIVNDVTIGLCIKKDLGGKGSELCERTDVEAADKSAATVKAPAQISCPDDPSCATTIVLREPVKAKIVAINLSGTPLGKPAGTVLKKGDLFISQWGELSYLPLRVGFAKSLSFQMGFDENGRKVSQTWDATARGSTLLGAATAVSDATLSAYKTIDGATVAEQKAEVERLNTLKAYNQARYCRAVIEAGGYTCP